MVNKILEFGNTYEKMRKEALNIATKIKPKVKSIGDAQIVHSLIESKDFYWKHDLMKVKKLAEKYNISLSNLEKFWKRYLELEKEVLKLAKKLEKLSLKEVSIGPKTISADGDKDSEIYIYIDTKKKKLDTRVYPKDKDTGWTENFEKFAEELKKKINEVIN